MGRICDSAVQLIERIFRAHGRIEAAIYERKHSRGGAYSFSVPPGSGHCRVPDPTAVQAIRNAVELETVTLDDGFRVFRPERWLRVYDAVKTFCSPDPIDVEIFRRRYIDGNTRVPYTIEQSVYSRHLLRIRNYAKICAAQEQLIRVF